MNQILEQIAKIGIVPVIALDHTKDAKPLAKALCTGGLPCAEVTFRTAAAEESIRIMTTEFPDMLVGAGTVLTVEQVDQAVNAGAKFIVSPGLNPKVVSYCIEKEIPVVPGCANPSDVELAMELGLEVVKFFPAEAAGGINMIKSMSAPYNKMKFMPTGGVNENNLKSYLDFKKVIACGGTWMVTKELISSGNFDEIARLTKEAVKKMLGFELKHIGMNAENETEASHIVHKIASTFGMEQKLGNSSIFIGTEVEVMKTPYLGEKGHIAIGTNDIERAIYHMELQGVTFLEDTKKYNAKGDLVAIYLKEQVGGFAFHLLQK